MASPRKGYRVVVSLKTLGDKGETEEKERSYDFPNARTQAHALDLVKIANEVEANTGIVVRKIAKLD